MIAQPPKETGINGFKCLAFNENAPGTPVVLIHGLLCSIYFWWPDHLSVFGNRPIFIIGLPGHYPSASIQSSATLDADSLATAVLDQVNYLLGPTAPFILIGHSTGAHAAIAAAAVAPDRVQGLISIGGAVTGEEEGGIYAAFQWMANKLGAFGRALISPALRASSLSLGIHRLFIGDVLAEPKKTVNTTAFQAYLPYYFPALQKISGASMGVYFRDLANMDLSDIIPSIQCPVLVMCGNRDPYVSIERTDELASMFPNSNVALIDGSGHMPMFENWPQYEAAIKTFMARVGQKNDQVAYA
ncbi:hypothetical protein KEHDKFFH_16515 [Marinobacter maroccanus]|uniref:AB hydrolase-1 domain-containing protein n=1 Tax=Marinobacter maroccanus TaxID=2055143 RepID=A0A2S5Z6M5_9GAMM|nr:alpha/beta hydrolase [Marinobacter maroccanus]PPI83039.1 hypothetical protein KEHDKFFH_16515 [Marinobacter maroccanus]